MSEQIPPGSLLDVMRTTKVGTERGNDGESLVIGSPVTADVAKSIFDLLAGRRHVRVANDLTDETFGNRFQQAIDYLQLPRMYTGISMSFLPYDIILHFPYVSLTRPQELSYSLRIPCRIQRIRHPDSINMCLVSFIGEESYDCAYRIEFPPSGVAADAEESIITMLARSATQPMHTSTFYLVHVCTQNPACRQRSAKPHYLDVETSDILMFLEVSYDVFGRFDPTLRVFGRPAVSGQVVTLPRWETRTVT